VTREFTPSRPNPDAPPEHPARETHWGPPEEEESLWWLAAAPTVWALHLLATYATAAIWCAKVAEGPGLGPVGWVIVVYTVVALVLVALVGRHGYIRQNHGIGVPPHNVDSPGDRHRFLGLATVLLAGISAVAILYVAVAVALVATCR
jgi:hypothetical protein